MITEDFYEQKLRELLAERKAGQFINAAEFERRIDRMIERKRLELLSDN